MGYNNKLTQRRKDAKKTHNIFAPLRLCVSLSLILLITPAMLAQVRRGITPADTLRVASVADAQISPDGEHVVYTVSTTDANSTRTNLWLARATAIPRTGAISRTPAPLLPAEWNAARPRWSPDSKRIAFLAQRDGQSGIWVVSLTERTPRFVAPIQETNFHIAYAGESFVWSPDSHRIAFISATDDATNAEEATTKKRDDPRVIDRIQYKSRTSFSDRARTHVWVVDVDLQTTNEPTPRQLTSGPYYDHAITWNLQGEEIAFLSNHESDPDANNNSDIFAVDLRRRTRQITDTPGC